MSEPTYEIVSDVTDEVGRRHVIENRGGYQIVNPIGMPDGVYEVPDAVVYRAEERLGDLVYSQSAETGVDSLIHDEPYLGIMWQQLDREVDRAIIDRQLSPPTPTEERLRRDLADLDDLDGE